MTRRDAQNPELRQANLRSVWCQERDEVGELPMVGDAAERARVRLAVGRVDRGDFDVCFILNPTSVEQVRNVADKGLVMPRKATYFFPKVITGLVINPLTS